MESVFEPVSNEAQMHGNDDSLPCSDAVVPHTAASQNPTPSPLEPSTGKRKPCKKESDVWEHFEKYDLVLDLKGVDETKRKEIEKKGLSASIVVLLMLVIPRKMGLAICGSI
ncbi:unnamed protein product [Prunus armeniaca]|uniref:Uncharacterized protein n=1 Tax=Prunus armeniaca TaxID=36596 RepID=A0A6J5TGV3_PRUAR|nr:unnamed protein product [Prunus armeniaca]